MRAVLRAAVLGMSVAAWADIAAAQQPDSPYAAAGGRLSLGGEISATVSPVDNDAFFNYTDYEHNALRTFRARLLGEWRAARRVAVLGELRLENNDSLDAAALYVRFRPSLAHDFTIQAGRIPPVIGAYVRHAYGRDNLVIGLPLAYQYLTSLRPDALPATSDDLLRMRARGWRPSFSVGSRELATGIPLVTASRWATGAEARWRVSRLDLAGAVTRGAPSVTPDLDAPSHLAWSGRAGLAAAPGLTLGLSAARGQWLSTAALNAVPEALRGAKSQVLMGADVEFGMGPVLIRGEWLRSAFEVPRVGKPEITTPLVAHSAFIEGRYRWHPRWQSALRVERLTFSEIQGTFFAGMPTPWDAPVTRIEAIMGYRATRHLEIRVGVQHNDREAGRVPRRTVPTAQVLYWF